MIYKFRSKASADLVMTRAVGDRVLALIGKAPGAQGILSVEDMPQALKALESAAGAEPARSAADDDAAESSSGGDDAVSLRRRIWPLAEMIRRSQAAGEPIVWGV